MCVYVCVPVCMQVTCVQCLQRPERALESLNWGDRQCDLPSMGAGNRTWPFGRAANAPNFAPSLLPLLLSLYCQLDTIYSHPRRGNLN